MPCISYLQFHNLATFLTALRLIDARNPATDRLSYPFLNRLYHINLRQNVTTCFFFSNLLPLTLVATTYVERRDKLMQVYLYIGMCYYVPCFLRHLPFFLTTS